MATAITSLGDGPVGPDPTSQAAGAFMSAHPDPTSGQIAEFLKAFDGTDRMLAAQELRAAGADSGSVASALRFVDEGLPTTTILGFLSIASMAACFYHGVKRHNGSFGWGLGWALFGTIAPVIGPVFAATQGFAKPLKKAS